MPGLSSRLCVGILANLPASDPHAYDHGLGEVIMHHPVRWIIIGMLILYVINQPDQAAAMAGHLGTKIGQWSVSLGNSLGTFTNKLGS